MRTTVRLVVAPTTVTDPRGNFVEGLTESDFRLRDNGRSRAIHVDVAYIPISLVVAVQCSSVSAAAVNKTRRIGGMIEPLVTGERGETAVVAFDSTVSVRQDFTADFGKAQKALARLPYGDEGGRMVDAVMESARLLAARPPQRRRVLILVSETRDRGSKAELEQAITLAQQENVTIYPLTYSAYATPFTVKAGTTPPPDRLGIDLISIFREIGRLGGTNAAEAFAQYTGGERLSFTRQRTLERAVARIGEELHSQYLLSFTAPAEADAVFHAIEVTVPGRPGARVRTRPGYWMAGAQP
jgi:VWFA-related protein